MPSIQSPHNSAVSGDKTKDQYKSSGHPLLNEPADPQKQIPVPTPKENFEYAQSVFVRFLLTVSVYLFQENQKGTDL